MAIALRSPNGTSTATLASNTSNIVITKPTGVQSTDALVLYIGVNNAGTPVSTYAAPTGWTAILAPATGGSGAAQLWLGGWVAYGSVANLTFTRTVGTGTENSAWLCLAYTGVDQTTIIDVAGANNNNAGSATIAALTFNTVTAGALEVIGAVDWNAGGSYSATSFTAVMNSPTTNVEVGAVYANSAISPAGATGSITVTDSVTPTGNFMAIMPFALRPVAGSTSVPETTIEPSFNNQIMFYGNQLLAVRRY